MLSSSVLAVLISCQSEKARKFSIQLDSTERKVFQIIAVDTLEKMRLQALVARNPDVAESIGNEQIQKLTDVINQLKKADVTELQYATPLKESNIQYYLGFIELKKLDIEEAKLVRISTKDDSTSANRAVVDISNLSGQRMELYKVIHRNDSIRQAAKVQFAENNHLR